MVLRGKFFRPRIFPSKHKVEQPLAANASISDILIPDLFDNASAGPFLICHDPYQQDIDDVD